MKMHIENEIQDQEYSVSEISTLIRKKLEQNFTYVKVKGEVSGLKVAPSGHTYFSLKDQASVLAAIIWRSTSIGDARSLKEGTEVICYGNITCYAGQSKYQMIVKNIVLGGEGALLALLEKRKKQLAAKGIFDQKHKKSLPKIPNKIGVITSISGAVIKDIIHRVADRFPTNIIVWPVLVQGQNSSAEVTNAINGFNKMHNKPDVIIVARGGGSIEDLWGFNEENVIMAAFNSNIPIISAIGHETDITLLDFVADKRAPTPTAAAEIVTPNMVELKQQIENAKKRSFFAIHKIIETNDSKIKILKKTVPDFATVLAIKQQHLDIISIRFSQTTQHTIRKLEQKLLIHTTNLRLPISNLKLLHSKTIHIKKALNCAMLTMIEQNTNKLNHLSKLLNNLSHKNVLKRGYAILWSDNKAVTNLNKIKHHDLELELKDSRAKISLKKLFDSVYENN